MNLKRFDFSAEGNNRKLNSYWEFPPELDLENYTQYAQLKHDIAAELITPETPIFELPKGYYKYKLRGVIVHIGSIDSGHYYSFIHDRESNSDPNRWLEFNDTMVRGFDTAKLPEEAFGQKEGAKPDIRESTAALVSALPEDALTKSNNAYMLVYERVIFFPATLLKRIYNGSFDPEDPGLAAELSQLGPRVIAQPPALSQIVASRLGEERNTNLLRQFLFHADYAELIANLLLTCEIPKEPNYVKNVSGTEIQMFAFTYFFTTALRSELSPGLCEIARYVKEICRLHKGVCIALASTFSLPGVIKEFVTDCPRAESRKLVSGVLKIVMETLYPDEEAMISDFVKSGGFLSPKIMQDLATSKKRSPKKDRAGTDGKLSGYRQDVESLDHSVPYLILLLDAFIQQAAKGTKGEYFQILTHFARLGKETKLYLVSCCIFGVCIEALDLTKRSDCRNYACTTMPHFCWKGNSMVGEIEMAKAGEEDSERASVSSQAPFIFELLIELLGIPPSESEPIKQVLRKSGVKEISKACDAETEYMQLLLEDTSLKALLRSSGATKLGLNFCSRFLLALCESKKEVFSVPVVSFLAKNLSACGWTELRTYMRPIQMLMRTRNDKLYLVY